MKVLDELAARTSDQICEEVHNAVLLLSTASKTAPRLVYRPVSATQKHLLYTTAHGLYLADLYTSGNRAF